MRGEQTVRVVVTRDNLRQVAPRIRLQDDVKPEAVYENLTVVEVDPQSDFSVAREDQIITVKDGVNLPALAAFRMLWRNSSGCTRTTRFCSRTVCPSGRTMDPNIALLRASVVIGALLADGIGDAILIRGESGRGQSLRLAYNILQASGCRSFKTIRACPSLRAVTVWLNQTVPARRMARHVIGLEGATAGSWRMVVGQPQ